MKRINGMGVAAVLALAAAINLSGCAASIAAPAPGAPVAEPAPVAAELARGTQIASPRRIAFGWELDEAGAKVRGKGVARVQPPERMRLDLFGPRGETYLAAALVGEDFRIPAALQGKIPLPSPALLWATLGVVRPPADATLREATQSGTATMLRYSFSGGVLEYRLEGGRLAAVRRLSGGGVAESIALSYDAASVLNRAEYRDWAAYRTLLLTHESSTNVDAFPEQTWNTGGR